MKKMIAVLIIAIVTMSQIAFSQTAATDECKRGTWKREGAVVYVCPNPGHGEWGGAASPQEIAAPQKWQELKGKREFLTPGQSRIFKDQKIVAFCEAKSIPYPKGEWEIGFDVRQSEYRFIRKVGIMLLCQ